MARKKGYKRVVTRTKKGEWKYKLLYNGTIIFDCRQPFNRKREMFNNMRTIGANLLDSELIMPPPIKRKKQ